MNVQTILGNKGRAVATIHQDATVDEAVTLLHTRGIGALVVSDDGKEVGGIISERDIVAALALYGKEVSTLRVAEVMTRPVVTCAPEDSVGELMAEMTNRRIRHFPVRDGRLCGIVSIGDLVKSRLDEVEFEANSLRSFIAGAALRGTTAGRGHVPCSSHLPFLSSGTGRRCGRSGVASELSPPFKRRCGGVLRRPLAAVSRFRLNASLIWFTDRAASGRNGDEPAARGSAHRRILGLCRRTARRHDDGPVRRRGDPHRSLRGGIDYNRWPVTESGASLYWAGLNKAKRSVALALDKPEGRELARAIATAPGPAAASC